MTADSAWDVQKALYARLSAESALTSLLAAGAGGICDHVPENTPFPYLVISEVEARPNDTQQGAGYDITITLRSYSRAEGMKELRGIMAAVFDALHNASFAVPNLTLILCQQVDAATRLEADGITRAGLQRFHLITEP